MLTPKHFHLCAIVLAIAAAVSAQTVSANVPDAPFSTKNTVTLPTHAQPDTDQLIIRFRDNASPVAVDKALSRLRTEKGEKFAYAKTTP